MCLALTSLCDILLEEIVFRSSCILAFAIGEDLGFKTYLATGWSGGSVAGGQRRIGQFHGLSCQLGPSPEAGRSVGQAGWY